MFDCLLLMAGCGSRTSLKYNKIEYVINNKPMYQHSLDKFLAIEQCKNIILVVNKNDYDNYKQVANNRIKVVEGGLTRSDSVLKGAKKATTDIILIHDAARPNIDENDILKVYNESNNYDAVCLGVKVKDCIRCSKDNSETLNRNYLWQIQTPQAVNRNKLIQGLESKKYDSYYDDCEVLEKNFNTNVCIVEGKYSNLKVTTDDDLEYIEYLMNKGINKYRIGHSKDTHRLVEGRKLILGGVEIPFDLGLLGHSDADVVYHCIVESIIGALGKGDIGTLFPDNDPKYKNISSSYFMNEIYQLMDNEGYKINNLDIIIYIEKPMLKEYKQIMTENIAKLLRTDITNINVKATRGEGLGYIGNLEGISAEAICLLVKKQVS